MSYLYNKIIGIWGYGTTGAAAVHHAQRHGAAQILVYDDKELSETTRNKLSNQHVVVYPPAAQTEFIKHAHVIIKSPGVSCTVLNHAAREKIVPEFDLFTEIWPHPIIAVTGTIGKTTITSCLSQLLTACGTPAVATGNIGTPMLSVADAPAQYAHAVVELSSYHTELGLQRGPDVAIISNVHPNHLDRHGTFEQYRAAKLELIRAQTSAQKAILPLALAPIVRTHVNRARPIAWFSSQKPSHEERAACAPCDSFYYYEEASIIHEHKQALSQLPPQHWSGTFHENILIITAALDQLGYDCSHLPWHTLTLPDHRLSHFATYQDITFYNDSKSTIPAATLAAVAQLAPRPIVLFLGGISKGVDRQPLIHALKATSVRHVVCFGAEAEQLATWCQQAGISTYATPTLEPAYTQYITAYRQPGDYVLFSPAGASFDLFKNYEARGDYFMDLVHRMHAA